MRRTSLFIMLLCLPALFPPRLPAGPQPDGDRPAYRAEDFVESLGLAAAPFERYLAEGPWKGAGTRYPPEFFFDLGIRYYRMGLRNDLTPEDLPRKVETWWRRTGARPLLLVDPGKSFTVKTPWLQVEKDGDFSRLVADLRRYAPGSVAGVEGPNEVNNKFPPQELNLKYKGRTDEAAGALYQRDLFSALRADPATRDIPVAMFTAIFTDYSLARPCDAFDRLNMHSYQNEGVPSSSLLMNITRAANILPAGAAMPPFQPTECGYNVEEDKTNRMGCTGSLRAQAYNIPMLYAEYFRHGIERTYLFALHNADGYGLLESDQETKRPSWHAVQSFVRLLADATWDPDATAWKGGRGFDPEVLRFRVEGAPATVHTLTLQKADGDWFLLVWNEVTNIGGGKDIARRPVPVVLRFAAGTPVECVEAWLQGEIPEDVHRVPGGVLQGAFQRTARPPATRENSLALEIPSRVMILRLRRTADAPRGTRPPAVPSLAPAGAAENSVAVRVSLPADHGAASVLLFRNGMHVATLSPRDFRRQDGTGTVVAEHIDNSAWIRPGAGYRYTARSVSAEGMQSAMAATVVVAADRRPDLVVGDFGPDLPPGVPIRPGDSVRFAGTVRNIGDGTTPAAATEEAGMWNSSVTITFAVDGKIVGWGGDDGQSPLAPGESRRHVAAGGPGGQATWTAAAGTHVLRAEADDINRISCERSEENNCATRTITVGACSGRLEMESRPAPGHIDLSAEGTLDWVHFGAWNGQGRLTRKPGAGLIGLPEQTGEGHVAVNPGCAVHLSWQAEGDVPAMERTHAGLWGNRVGNGYTFTVPAGTEERVLRVCTGVTNGGRGEFAAELSDGSAPAFVDDAWDANRGQAWAPVPGDLAVLHTVRFRAARDGETLRVTWKLREEPNRFLAQIRLQAATLSVAETGEGRETEGN